MPSKKSVIKVYVTQAEHARISELAESTGLSLSTFAKRVCLGFEVNSLEHIQLRNELRKIRGDLGRIGGLIKQTLAAGSASKHTVYKLLGELDARQEELKNAVDKI